MWARAMKPHRTHEFSLSLTGFLMTHLCLGEEAEARTAGNLLPGTCIVANPESNKDLQPIRERDGGDRGRGGETEKWLEREGAILFSLLHVGRVDACVYVCV